MLKRRAQVARLTLMLRRFLLLTCVFAVALGANGASRYVADRAGAPVQWQAWGDAALQRAAREKRPIFLSIGFASSDECFRMHRGAFLNGENAEALNGWFVPVLLDRLEHPEIAEAYEAAAKAMSGVSGWPVNLVLTPKLEPIAAAGSMTGEELNRFLVIEANHWRERAGADAYVAPPAGPKPNAPPDVEAVVDAIAKTYDPADAAFGGLPRRPAPMTISFLLRYAARAKHEGIRGVAIESLKRMAIAPVRDQLGGGFHRATHDAAWKEPFFEKMLSDQALLTMAYLDALRQTNDPELAYVARTTLDFVLRDLRGGGRGAFDSSQDAYNFVPLQGPELINANFYLWQKDEITRLVGRETAAKVFKVYPMKDGVANLPALAEWRFLPETHGSLAEPLAKMLDVRQKRPEPSREFNVVTGRNGLMISALARGGAMFGEESYVAAATSAATDLVRRHWNAKTKTLQHSDGVPALAEDYAFLVQGLLDLYEAGHDVQWLELAIALQQRQDELFWDASAGEYATGQGVPRFLRALVRETDDEVPAASSVAARNLLRLGALTGAETWRARPAVIFQSFGGRMRAHGAELAEMAHSWELAQVPARIAVVTGDWRMKATHDVLQSYERNPEAMRALVYVPDRGTARDRVTRVLPFTRALAPEAKSVVAWECAAGECRKVEVRSYAPPQ